MSALFLRSLAVSSISVLLLAGCSNKKFQAKIKDLEADIENLETAKEEALDAKDEEIRDKEQEFEKTQQESTAKIDEITQERDRLNSELSDMKQKVAQLEAEIDAKTPKDASTPGHADFNPAKEEKFANAMAIITGDTVSGTGFIAEDGGKRYVYTTAALLGGNSRLAVANASGTKFTKFGNIEVADGCSFVRVELLEADDAPALQIAAAGFQITTESKLCCLGITPSNSTVTGEMIAPFGQSNETIDLDPNLLTGKTGGPIIDVGSGGGTPGIPLAATFPGRPVTLLDAERRKCAFLETWTADLPNLSVVRVPAEGQEGDRFGVAVAKALTNRRPWAEWCPTGRGPRSRPATPTRAAR